MEGINCKACFKVLYKDTIGCGDRIYLVWPYLPSKINIKLSAYLYVFYYLNKCYYQLSQVHYPNILNSNHHTLCIYFSMPFWCVNFNSACFYFFVSWDLIDIINLNFGEMLNAVWGSCLLLAYKLPGHSNEN